MAKRDPETKKGLQKERVEFARPTAWDVQTVFSHLIEQLSGRGIPAKRVRYQVEQDAEVQRLRSGWDDRSDPQSTWEELVAAGRRAIAELLPICLQCGQCCRSGSPTLHVEDLELLKDDKIRPEALRTLREGEPVHSPLDGRVFYLDQERIKIKEKPGTSTCMFLDEQTDQCRIWKDRPLQCRAQSCWDGEPARQASARPLLTRSDVLGGVDVLLQLLDEHSRRCSHEKLRLVFEKLEASKGQEIEPVLEALAFEDHFRGFVAERFNLPEDTLDFFFGRSFVGMLRLFGFRLDESPDGTRTLLPLSDQDGA